jgi:lysyl-tRNA synthetase class I
LAYGLLGAHDEARAVLHRLEEGIAAGRAASIHAAWVHVGLGEYERAMDLIERAFEEHDSVVLFLAVSPDWDPLRREPRFGQLLERLARETTSSA